MEKLQCKKIRTEGFLFKILLLRNRLKSIYFNYVIIFSIDSNKYCQDLEFKQIITSNYTIVVTLRARSSGPETNAVIKICP